MTEWRDCTAFFFPRRPEREEDWLHETTRHHSFLTTGHGSGLPGGAEAHQWAGLPVRLQAIHTRECAVLAISYYHAEFASHLADAPAAWERFCTSFAGACLALDPLAAVAFGIPSDDLAHDVGRYGPAIFAGDGDWLRAQTYELLYVGRELAGAAAPGGSSPDEPPGRSLANGGRVTAGDSGRGLPLP